MRGAPPGLAASAQQPKAAGAKPQRAGQHNGKGGPKPSSGGRASSPDAMAERLGFIAAVLVGYRVRVQVKSGLTYEGVLHAIRQEGRDLNVELQMAEVTKAEGGGGDQQQPAPTKPVRKLVLHSRDVVHIATTAAVNMAPQALASSNAAAGGDDAGGFGTDAAIGARGKATGFGRELQRWAPSKEDEGLEPITFGNNERAGGWDQFAAFERMTGNRTTFTEEQYTTKLDRSDPRIRAMEAKAERLAREIEGQSSTNYHVAEERGHQYDDSGLDEEDKYSGVVRGGARSGAGAGAGARAGGLPSKPPSQQQHQGAGSKGGHGVGVGSAQGKPRAPPSSGGGSGAKPSQGAEGGAPKVGGTGTGLKPKLGLNPNAQPFKFNVNAKAFVPGGRKPTAAGAAGAGGGAGGGGGAGVPRPAAFGGAPQGMVAQGMMGTYFPSPGVIGSAPLQGQPIPQVYRSPSGYANPGVQMPVYAQASPSERGLSSNLTYPMQYGQGGVPLVLPTGAANPSAFPQQPQGRPGE